jgi:hypothetical protein
MNSGSSSCDMLGSECLQRLIELISNREFDKAFAYVHQSRHVVCARATRQYELVNARSAFAGPLPTLQPTPSICCTPQAQPAASILARAVAVARVLLHGEVHGERS